MSIQARIIAEKGSIVIGNDNLIEEAVLIKNTNEETLYIGNENIFEVQSEFIGEFAVFFFALWIMKKIIPNTVFIPNKRMTNFEIVGRKW